MAKRIAPEAIADTLSRVYRAAHRDGAARATRAAQLAAEAGQAAFLKVISTSALPHSKNPPGRVKTGAMKAAAAKPRLTRSTPDRVTWQVGWPDPAAQREYFLHQEYGTRYVKAMNAMQMASTAIDEALSREAR